MIKSVCAEPAILVWDALQLPRVCHVLAGARSPGPPAQVLHRCRLACPCSASVHVQQQSLLCHLSHSMLRTSPHSLCNSKECIRDLVLLTCWFSQPHTLHVKSSYQAELSTGRAGTSRNKAGAAGCRMGVLMHQTACSAACQTPGPVSLPILLT